ncbi:PEP-CTERM sorting domain-containing protein [Photobacterium sanguinicancri]|uniref:PEP-CTERM sorting domain-containing protein n=2 Tax=Photobacterium sanguinicancri TaxID=875932 RepID=A0AAW7Y1C7_9GAMM|nr:PEP-CTERM sorting domain-containing protein [Photobacterium sanguinicancri]MDO6541229.1 PEP-CTERM sorting domain-containing protein [Photobacterium sanguinicancri]
MRLLNKMLVVAALVIPTYSHAASIACDAAIENKVTLNMGCEVGSQKNDKLNPTLAVNDDAMFGITNWEFFGKIFEGGSGDNSLDINLSTGNYTFSATGDLQMGTWSMTSGIWTAFDDIMLVFKGGNPNFTGYHIKDGEISGSYMTPQLKDGKPQDISHISFYGVKGDGVECQATPCGPIPPVPEPSSIALFMLGMTGVGCAVRRRKNKQ